MHASLRDKLAERLKRAYASLRIGNPLEDGVLVGPLIDAQAYAAMRGAPPIRSTIQTPCRSRKA